MVFFSAVVDFYMDWQQARVIKFLDYWILKVLTSCLNVCMFEYIRIKYKRNRKPCLCQIISKAHILLFQWIHLKVFTTNVCIGLPLKKHLSTCIDVFSPWVFKMLCRSYVFLFLWHILCSQVTWDIIWYKMIVFVTIKRYIHCGNGSR